jgi:uncharacterized repeat protein (TIGR01451 family)
LLGLLLANAAGAVLLAATLYLLAGARPVAAGPAAQSSSIALSVSVATDTGLANVASNGTTITYTVRLSNTSSSTINSVQAIDTVPFDALTNIQCLGPVACQHLFQSNLIPEPLGGTLLVTVTRQLSWTATSIPPGGAALLVFSGRIAGQADGTIINNVASVLRINGSPVSGLTNNSAVTVRVPVQNLGHSEISNAATWFSADLGGTLSQDWGDINRDGYMDLVLGSSVGTSVFINEGGRLKKLNWANTDRSYGVRLADFTGDGRLDLVIVGASQNGQANQPGTNYIYGQLTDPVTLSPTFGLSATFNSDFQLVRVGVGNFDPSIDNDVDIVASTNSINAPCPVLLYRNNGAGQSPSHHNASAAPPQPRLVPATTITMATSTWRWANSPTQS